MLHRFFSCSVLYRFAYAAALLALAALLLVPHLSAQTESATVLGRVTDPTGAVLSNVEIEIRNIDTNVAVTSSTNSEGLYAIHSLSPGHYVISVHKQGFKTVSLTGLSLNVQDNLIRNFTLQIGAVSESITVNAESAKINTTDATVSTVVDRNFAENLPMNGRSFQSLIQLTPGVVTVPTNGSDGGQFSVNGQRSSSNYWTVDGVSANIGVSATNTPGSGLGGALSSFSAQGGTNSLVSVDAMEEFRIQTSTFAPEFGRTPGAQIFISTRSGTNQFHGTAFDYVRNDFLDANDWFANSAGLAKPRERQNDFGGTLGGPLLKDRSFFFLSFEGLRLQLPQTTLTTVPCDNTCQVFGNARALAVQSIQPFLNAFPLPNGPEAFTPCIPNQNGCPASGRQPTGTADFSQSYSNPATLNASSIRIDHKLGQRLMLFGRYNYSPSQITNRGANSSPLSIVTPIRITTQTATFGATVMASPKIANDLRVNYSRTKSSSTSFMDDFGGAVPLTIPVVPNSFSTNNSVFAFFLAPLKTGRLLILGRQSENLQRQVNIVDGLSIQTGLHSLKFGVDYRRMSPIVNPPLYLQEAFFGSMAAVESGSLLFASVESSRSSTFLFHNVGAYAQDTWHATPYLTLTYGLRWDIDVAPAAVDGPGLPAVVGFASNNLSDVGLAPAGVSPFSTTVANIAPRFGIAYALSRNTTRQTVIRGGFGIFYDLVSPAVGTLISSVNYPFGSSKFVIGGNFPLDSQSATPPPIEAPNAANGGTLAALDPHIKLPYTLQWNVALEQSVGARQTISATYVGASGRRLLQTENVLQPNANLAEAELVGNTGASNYNALQVQFRRDMAHGLQALASYTWSHSIDNGSATSAFSPSNAFVPNLGAGANRGASDFDERHTFSLGTTYNIPTPTINGFPRVFLRDWSVQNIFTAFSAPPVDVFYDNFSFGGLLNSVANVRPDIVPNQPFYVTGSQCVAVFGQSCPGGKGLNPAAFTPPPLDPTTGNPIRQGNLGRNALRGLGAFQWDLAVHRDFPIRESLKLQFRAEMFNVLNHPNFGRPIGDIGSPGSLNPQFGQSQFMLGQSLSGAGQFGNVGNGSFSPLYQIGGPRSIQCALKLMF